MTRLTGEWMRCLMADIETREKDLVQRTGLDFAGIAAAANGMTKKELAAAADRFSVAVIPITQGLGVIESFAESVAAIIVRAGFSAFVTTSTDVTGFYEAYRRGADMVFFADDTRFVGFRLDIRRLIDNNEATAQGYVAALEAAAGSLAGRRVLVLGCGVIGREAGLRLIAKGAAPVYYDSDPKRLNPDKLPGGLIERDASCIGRYALIFDATNTGGWLHKGMLREDAWVTSPGVPLSLDEAAMERYGAHVIHDDLEIGTLTMLGGLCKD
jgi:pyrrolysine biosynthesis protein PylD